MTDVSGEDAQGYSEDRAAYGAARLIPEKCTDAALLDALEWVGSRIVIDSLPVKYEGKDHYEQAWYVSGAGLGGAGHPTLRESLTDFLTGLVSLSEHDPDYFKRHADMPHFGSDFAAERCTLDRHDGLVKCPCYEDWNDPPRPTLFHRLRAYFGRTAQ